MTRLFKLASVAILGLTASSVSADVPQKHKFPDGSVYAAILQLNGYDCGPISGGLVCTKGGEKWICDSLAFGGRCHRFLRPSSRGHRPKAPPSGRVLRLN